VSWLERNRSTIALVLAGLLTAGGIAFLLRMPAAGRVEVILPPTSAPVPTATPAPLHVYVCGAVAQPDVYALAPGSIVKDAIVAAGGATQQADLLRINLAQALDDGAQVYVPAIGETPAAPAVRMAVTAAPAVASPSQPVNLNSASLEELDTLPGIGPALAQRIVEHRPYRQPQDLLDVPGIGPATYEKLKDLVVVQ